MAHFLRSSTMLLDSSTGVPSWRCRQQYRLGPQRHLEVALLVLGEGTSLAGLLSTSIMLTHPLSGSLPTPHPLSRPLSTPHLFPLCFSHMSFPSLYHLHIISLSSFACTSMLMKGCCLLIRDPISRLPVRIPLLVLLCCWIVVLALLPGVAFSSSAG